MELQEWKLTNMAIYIILLFLTLHYSSPRSLDRVKGKIGFHVLKHSWFNSLHMGLCLFLASSIIVVYLVLATEWGQSGHPAPPWLTSPIKKIIPAQPHLGGSSFITRNFAAMNFLSSSEKITIWNASFSAQMPYTTLLKYRWNRSHYGRKLRFLEFYGYFGWSSSNLTKWLLPRA